MQTIQTMPIDPELQQEASSRAIELAAGQCTVIQCNHEVGRSLVLSFVGKDKDTLCRVYYKGEQLTLTNQATARQTGLCALDEGQYQRLKVREYLAFWAELYGCRPPLKELMERFGLAQKAQVRISRLSPSEQRLLGFARSLLHDPELIIWEEPEQQLDLGSSMIVRRMIAELIARGKTLLITCSTLEQSLSISSRIFRLSDNRFVPVSVQETAEPEEAELPGTEALEEAVAEQGTAPLTSQTALPLPARLMVKTEDKYLFIDPLDIYVVESNEGQTHLYTKLGSFVCAWTLAELEVKLQPYRFFRCHRSYIVNLAAITELIVWSRNSYSLVLGDEQHSRIPLAKSKMEELKVLIEL
ncbi:LytTR family transcriptional regulator DNA-binding domain-containing protein [Paenibacillus daejeonensis]|uniref:LytTR family transcriptional regulator DNA-binding domain-containing protein n=1 Tax=Paenibacillus daejeonensis TaxID=135193 RepID=UPI00036B6F93|nr:LytTR family transcriptional regulator DNA-binding domain-containing protein [Paenibacillus daejeonensis]